MAYNFGYASWSRHSHACGCGLNSQEQNFYTLEKRAAGSNAQIKVSFLH